MGMIVPIIRFFAIRAAVFSAWFLAANAAWGLPSLPFENLKGEKVDWKESKDKQLVVFWATWCGECKEKLLKTLPEIASQKNISVIAMNVDEDRERAEAYVKKNGVKLPVLREPSGQLLKDLNISAIPYWIVYEKDPAGQWKTKDSAVAFHLDRVKKALDLSN